MIPLTQQLCETLDLVYWKLKDNETIEVTKPLSVYHLPEDQKELLKNILLAIQVHLDNSMVQSIEETKVCIKVRDKLLIFEDVTKADTDETIHLAGLQQMQQDPAFKKQTWLKLKTVFL
jgi:hypothetical protein